MSDHDSFRRILVICTRQIGDVLLTTPLIDAAKKRWPGAQVDVLGFVGTLGMLRGNPHIGELIEVRAGSGWLQSLSLIRRLWRRYDLALIAQYSDRAHLYGAVAARRRSGLVTSQRSTSWWKRALLVHAVAVDVDPTHAVLEKLRLLTPWASPPEAVLLQPPPRRELPPGLALRLQARYVVVQVPSLVRYKQWPIAHYMELAQGLLDEGLQVVLSGGPSTADRARTAEVMQGVLQASIRRTGEGVRDALQGALASARASEPEAATQPAVPTDDDRLLDIAGTLELNQMTTLLRGAALYIGPDTSITHLAAAVETPLIALYGPIDPRLFGPWPQGHAPVQPYVEGAARQQPSGRGAMTGDQSGQSVSGRPRPALITLLQGEPACVPCNGMGCDGHNESRSECLETMPAQRVLAEARLLLGIEARVATITTSIPLSSLQGRHPRTVE